MITSWTICCWKALKRKKMLSSLVHSFVKEGYCNWTRLWELYDAFFNEQVGLLLEVGKELAPPTAAREILASRSRTLLADLAPTAPPHGLYLMHISYDDADLEPPPGSPSKSCGIMQTYTKCKLLQLSKWLISCCPLGQLCPAENDNR